MQSNLSSKDSTPKDFTSGETKILMCIIKHLKGDINVASTDHDAYNDHC